MRNIGLLAFLGMMPVWAGQMPEKAADYHAALMNRPESAALFDRFRDAWLEERSVEDLEKELLARAEAKEPGAWATLGRAWLATGKSEQALEAFDKARKQTPSAWLDLETAKLRMAAKDFAAAEKDALTVPEGDPQRLEALKLAGLACLRAERIDEALAHWTKAVSAAPGDIGLLEDLTELTRREGRIELALDYCGKWRDATADAYGKAMATLRRSELLLGSQRFDEAMTELAAVLEVSAEDSWLERESLARAEQAHRQRGNSTGWATWIGTRAEANPARLSFRRTSAQALAAAGKVDEALEVLTEVMKRSPGDTAVRWQRIALLEQSMKLKEAYDECAELAAKEKTEAAGLRLAELAFRLEKKDELQRALDGVLAAAEPGKRVGLAGLYARYGLPESSERIWREEATGEQGALALRLLAKHLQTAGRDKQALEVWKQLGARDVALDRMEAAQMLAVAGERAMAREILSGAREKFSAEPGYEAALADLAMTEEKADKARAIYLKLARSSKRPEELTAAAKGWLRASGTSPDPIKDLGDETAERCLRAAWLASTGKPLPAIREGDELEHPVRQALLREMGRWAEVVAMMEARPGDRGPLFLSELAEAKLAANDLTGALAVTQIWRTRVPDQTSPWLFEAGILEKLGKLSEATQLLRRAAARFEDNEEVARRLFAALQQALDPRESLEFAWKRHDRSQDESVRSGWLRQILEVSKERQQLDALQARFEERARRDPASPGPLMALAELAKARGDSRSELDFLRRAATNAPRDAVIISRLASLEELSGETARALERHVTLARLAPGPDTARQLAQAKIRLGDIEGGMRDLQTLSGQSGLDLKALEMSVGDLASRGYVEEAIRMLAAIDPARRTARLEFIRGTLLDIDGREREAVECFLRVLAEPDDPAEATIREAYGTGRSRRINRYSRVLQIVEDRDVRYPGSFVGYQVPQSLVEAQEIVKSRLCLLAMNRGGEFWQVASKAVSDLSMATRDHWREALEYSKARGRTSRVSWWEFFRLHPSNPLGPLLIVDFGQTSEGKPDEIEAVLKSKPPFSVQLQLRWGRGVWRVDQPEFLESARPEDWRDEQVQAMALAMATQMSMQAIQESAKPPTPAAHCARAMAVLEKVEFTGSQRVQMELLRSRMALMAGDVDGFLRHLIAWSEMDRGKSAEAMVGGYGSSPPIDAFASWRKTAGDAAAEAVLAKIPSPLLRCLLANDQKSAARLARIKRELAALPPSAPAETRRGLIRLSWQSLSERNSDDEDPFRPSKANPELIKQLEAAAADESDPRLMVEAMTQLMHYRSGDSDISQKYLLKLNQVATRLAASTDPADQAYAARFVGNSVVRQRGNPQTIISNWGPAASFSGGSSGRTLSRLPVILAMEDRKQAEREAAKSLEDQARAFSGRPEYLRQTIDSLAKTELLDAALSRISIPPDAGLGRRVALLTLMEAADRKDRSLALLAELAAARPWETTWTVRLALLTPDDLEMRRLLDLVAEREDFDQILAQLLVPLGRGTPNEILAQLARLADWAPQAKGARGWMEPALLMLAGSGGGLQPLTSKNIAQLDCCRRYMKLALTGRKTGEFGFRVMTTLRYLEPADTLNEAAFQALLSGAYTSRESAFSSQPIPENMQLAALEHLVLLANSKGDEVAFPAEFRERLKVVDPELDAWISKLLAARTVAELPEVANTAASSSGWVSLARHEAAMIRAIHLPGRDRWLLGVFKANQQDSLSQNIRHVIRESLLEASKSKTLSSQVVAFLEASAGPRKDWGKKVAVNQESAARFERLQQTAASILNAVVDSEPSIFVGVLDQFREARVPVKNADSIFNNLANNLRRASRPENDENDVAKLLGSRGDAPFTFGAWQAYGGDRSLIFKWHLPELMAAQIRSMNSETLKRIKSDPKASFLDLYQVSASSGDRALRNRALLQAAPDLVKLPVELRNAVIDELTERTTEDDDRNLPTFIAARVNENRAAARKERIASTRTSFESFQAGRSGNSGLSQQLGQLLSQVIGEDPKLEEEILTAWKALAEKDKSGRISEEFLEGLLSNRNGGLSVTLALLRQVDGVWKISPPAAKSSRSSDHLGAIFSSLTPDNQVDPTLWRQIAVMEPKLQARLWLESFDQFRSRFPITTEPRLAATLREAAKGGEVTRAALELLLTRSDAKEQRLVGAALLGSQLDYLKALRYAGATATDILPTLAASYNTLSRMETPAILMAETPGLLTGLTKMPPESCGLILMGLVHLWERRQDEGQRTNGDALGVSQLTQVHPTETSALLKFLLSTSLDLSQGYVVPSKVTSVILSLDDQTLLDLWIKEGARFLNGDLTLICALLERNRVAEAIALSPKTGSEVNHRQLYFTRKLESQVEKLRNDPSVAAFRLLVRLSITPDARGEDAPTANSKERRTRLLADYIRLRKDLTLDERAETCLMLTLNDRSGQPTGILDEFVTDQAAREFKAMLTGERSSHLGQLFVPAVCSRVEAGDLSGFDRLTAIFDSLPAVRRNESVLPSNATLPLYAGLLSYIASAEGKLNPAAQESILSCAKLFAYSKYGDSRGLASHLVHLIFSDRAALDSGLKRCGLEGVKPSVSRGIDFLRYGDSAKRRALLRLALLHPVESEVLVNSLVPQRDTGGLDSVILPILHDAQLCARLSPAAFLNWTRYTMPAEVAELEDLKLYASERRAEFNEAQRVELDRLLARWGTASDPRVLEQMKLQRDALKLREDQLRSRWMQGE